MLSIMSLIELEYILKLSQLFFKVIFYLFYHRICNNCLHLNKVTIIICIHCWQNKTTHTMEIRAFSRVKDMQKFWNETLVWKIQVPMSSKQNLWLAGLCIQWPVFIKVVIIFFLLFENFQKLGYWIILYNVGKQQHVKI